jgi:hypothetical protein
MKSRNDAAKILTANGWNFEEIESVLIKRVVVKKRTVKKPNKTSSQKPNKTSTS